MSDKRKQVELMAWAGFVDGVIHTYHVMPEMDESGIQVAIFKTRKSARKYYDDVRKVRIVTVKP